VEVNTGAVKEKTKSPGGIMRGLRERAEARRYLNRGYWTKALRARFLGRRDGRGS